MARYININYDNDLILRSKLDLYYFVGPHFESKQYPATFDTVDKDVNIGFDDEIYKLSTVKPITKWIVNIIDACNDASKQRKRYITYQPEITKEILIKLSNNCRCSYCVLLNGVDMMFRYDENTVLFIDDKCLRNGSQSSKTIFDTLDFINKTTNNNNTLYRGSNIMQSHIDKLNIIDYYTPYVYTNAEEFKIQYDAAWLQQHNHLQIPNDPTYKLNMCCYTNTLIVSYPFINRWFIKVCIMIDKNSDGNQTESIWYLWFGCPPNNNNKLIDINNAIKMYCQCSTCKASKWNPLKYIFKTKKCLKVNQNLWSSELHKKTLSVYSKIESLNITIN